MKRRTTALLLAVLVVLAGCAGTTSRTATTESDATTTEPATTTGTDLDPATADLPPGVNASGVENASRLLSAHRDALSESDFQFRLVADTSLEDGYVSRSVTRGTVSENFAPFRIRAEAETRTGNRTIQYETDMWGNESVVFTRYSVGNRTQYRKQDVATSDSADGLGSMRTADPARQASQSQVVRFALLTGEYEVDGVEARDGATLTTLRATGVNRSFDGGNVDDGSVDRGGIENASHYDSTLVVDERGRVHRLNTTLRAEGMDVSYDFRITEFGEVSIEYPEWADRALATVNAQVEVDSEDGYFVVSNEAGDALPSGSEIRASHDGVNATLELSDPLRPGERAYVYFPEDGERPVLTTEPPEEGVTTELRGEYEFGVVDPTGQSLLNAGFGFGSASAPATATGDGTSGDDTSGGDGTSDGDAGDSGSADGGMGGHATTADGGVTTTAGE